MKSFTGILEKTESTLLWNYTLPVPEDIAKQFIEGTNRRVVCTLNKSITIHSALMSSGQGWFIMINKSVRDQLGLRSGEKIKVEIKKDTSEYGMEMPEELSVLLEQDEQGNKYFHSLTPGKQRNLIYIVNKVKNTNSRLNKALAIVHHLKTAKGKLDFKELNVVIKDFNQHKNLS